MNISPLKQNDIISIVAPAKAIEKKYVIFAKQFFEKNGYKVIIGKHCLGEDNYFSGTIESRLIDFQTALDDSSVKAIICARGGYGCVQLVDLIDWTSFIKKPKWIVGFSDITVLHQRIQCLGMPSIHGTMPLDFYKNTKQSLSTLVYALNNNPKLISWKNKEGVYGETSGIIVGGNLSILFSLLGTNDQIDYRDKILFIEDLCEQLYHLDRMFYALKKCNILKNIRGIVVGSMSNMEDTEIPFGKNYKEIILSHTKTLNIPIAFDFPAGHQDDNCAIMLGRKIKFVSSEMSRIEYQ